MQSAICRLIYFTGDISRQIPEAAARVYDEVADGSLALFLLEQRVVAAEQFHSESVVGDVEHGSQLISQVDGRRVGFTHLLTPGVLVRVHVAVLASRTC